MRKFKIFYHDNSGPKCEEFEGRGISFRDDFVIIHGEFLEDTDGPNKVVIAIPTDCIYSVEEID